MLVDPVCGKRIQPKQAYHAIGYRGITYYLCCPLCQAAFEGAPERFAQSEVGEPHASRSADFVYTTTVVRSLGQ
jgi:Cu+-exporting ATPase